MKLASIAAVLALSAASAAGAQQASDWRTPDPDNVLVVDTNKGRIIVELSPEIAPNHVARVRDLAKAHFYDNLTFFRVIDGFMAQTGDPEGTGRGGMGDKLPAEFSKEPFVRGTVGMARTNDPNSAQSQFFIDFAPAPSLTGQYTVWGKVTKGMECVDKIKKGEPPSNPDKMIRVRVAADVKE